MRIKRIPLVSANAATAAAGTVTNGVGYLIVTAAAAWAVFTKIAVGTLLNLDLIWAIALIVTRILTVAAKRQPWTKGS